MGCVEFLQSPRVETCVPTTSKLLKAYFLSPGLSGPASLLSGLVRPGWERRDPTEIPRLA